MQWQANWEDEGRRQWHESKMASKVEEEELKSVREKLNDRLESLEKKIQDPPKPPL